MRTNIEIDDQLMRQAMRISGANTKKATVEQALRLLVQTRAQASMRRLRGKVKWNGNLDESRRGRVQE
jgi:Arc/MetJ family transcription regulator